MVASAEEKRADALEQAIVASIAVNLKGHDFYLGA